jgi:hypothetical protein
LFFCRPPPANPNARAAGLDAFTRARRAGIAAALRKPNEAMLDKLAVPPALMELWESAEATKPFAEHERQLRLLRAHSEGRAAH